AALNLALVLFLDAARFDVDELRREWRIPLLDLGPGTLLTIAGISVAAGLLLHTSPIQSLLLGAVLASTDPIVLPIVLIAIQIMLVGGDGGGGAGHWIGFLAELLVLSPIVGIAVGGIGAWLMGKADERYSIRREYQALYGIG